MYSQIRTTVANTFASCVVSYDPIEKKLEELYGSENGIDKEEIKKSLMLIRRARYQMADTVFMPDSRVKERLIKPELIVKYAEKIHEFDPSFVVPSVESKTNPTGGCYIATAVYGSYDCPQVWTLRRYRDYTLASTCFGRAFIHAYYAISPILVLWFGNTIWFKKLWKPRLDKMVARLNSEGVADTPYSDRNY